MVVNCSLPVSACDTSVILWATTGLSVVLTTVGGSRVVEAVVWGLLIVPGIGCVVTSFLVVVAPLSAVGVSDVVVWVVLPVEEVRIVVGVTGG